MDQNFKGITFRSSSEKWKFIIFFSFLLLFSMLAYQFLEPKSSLLIFIIFLIIIVPSLLSHYLTKGTASMSIYGETLMIDLNYENLNIGRTFEIPLTNIRGFEVSITRKGHTDLIIYLCEGRIYRFELTKVEEQSEVRDFLSSYITELKRESNPNFKNYTSALLFVMGKMIINIICISAILLLIYQFNKTTDYYKLCMIIVPLSLISWWILICYPLKKKMFRYNGYSILNSLFTFLAPLLFIPIQINLIQSNIKPIYLKEINGVAINNYNAAYLINKYDLEIQESVHGYEIGSGSSKSNVFPVTHYFLTPLKTNKLQEAHSIWILQEKNQKISKHTKWSLRMEYINQFGKNSASQFAEHLGKKPIFYQLLYRDGEQRSKFYYPRSLVNAFGEVILLEPHWESVSTYKENSLTTALWLFGGILLLNLVSSLIIAGYR